MVKRFGWFFLAKECADFTNSTYFDIMDKPALEVAGLCLVMQAKIKTRKK